jgi:hypothetical protein
MRLLSVSPASFEPLTPARASTTDNVVGTSLAAVGSSKLTLHITNAGSAKKGTVILWVR